MTEKRFIEFMTQNSDDGKWNHGFEDMVREEWYHTKDEITAKKCVDLLNEQEERIQELESENKMLKTTISRNEAYINQIKTIGKWSNTGDVE